MRLRKVLLIATIVLMFLVLVALSAVTLLWMSVGGTFFRGEAAPIGTVFQIAVAVLACVGLAFLIRWLVHSTKKVYRPPGRHIIANTLLRQTQPFGARRTCEYHDQRFHSVLFKWTHRNPMRVPRLGAVGFLLLCLLSTRVMAQETSAQEPPGPPPEVHEHVAVTAPVLTPTRETSGTGWIPPVTPMYGVHRPWRGWDVRLNGAASLQGLYEPGYRHRTGGAATRQLAITNWGMAMARRDVGRGRFGVRAMLSAEPWTVPGCGSLNSLATGEVCEGDTVHDRQQSHDLFMELAADYDRQLRGVWRWQLYAGLAGEPALGPPGYPHRASAMGNPVGPVTHHWLDSTHITFGVVTAGVHNQSWKVEASVFNGREPDERRVDFDLGGFDSASARLSFLPTERLAVQVSTGRVRDARTDFIQRQDAAVRTTASATYQGSVGTSVTWATTAAYGMQNAHEAIPTGVLDATTSVSLIESSLTVSGRHTVFGRGEFVEMPAHHLHAHEYATAVFPVGKLQIGYVRHLGVRKGVVPGIGGSFSISLVSQELAPRYSGAAPSFGIFFNLQPARHQM